MDERENPRPGTRRDTAVSRERPRTVNRPASARPRSGNAAAQARARQERQAVQIAPMADLRQAGQPSRGPNPSHPAPAEKTSRPKPQPPRKKKKRKKRPHRIYNTNFGFKFVTMLAVVAVILLSMVIFFKVKHVYVDITPPTDEAGNVEDHSYYTDAEVIEASGINIDDNLLSLSKATVASRIHTALPYINEIQIKKKLPGTVVITVSEFHVTYGIQDTTGQWWLMSREGRILEQADEQSVKGHLTVTGMPIQPPELGDYLKPAAVDGADLSELAAKRTSVVNVLEQLEAAPFAKQIVSIDMSASYDIILWYNTQFEIKLGNTEKLSYKLQYLQAVLLKLGKEKSGTIDLTFTEDNGAHFLPFG